MAQKIEKEKAAEEQKELEMILKQAQEKAEIESKFKGLYDESKGILRDFFDDHNHPRQLWVDSEGVQQLESRDILEKDSVVTIHSANIKMCSYKIKQWAWDYLQNNQQFIGFSYNGLQNMI